MKNQITNLRLSERLKELGVPQISNFYWHINLEPATLIWDKNNAGGWGEDFISAFLASEILSKLPDILVTKSGKYQLTFIREGDEYTVFYFQPSFEPFKLFNTYELGTRNECLANAAAELYIGLVGEGFLPTPTKEEGV